MHFIYSCIYLFPSHLDALVPVTTVLEGEPVTFTCIFPIELPRRQLHWYKQGAGDKLHMIAALQKHAKPLYGTHFSTSRVEVEEDIHMSNLTILRTIPEDEGMYHCAVMGWLDIFWSATYLMVKGKHASATSAFE